MERCQQRFLIEVRIGEREHFRHTRGRNSTRTVDAMERVLQRNIRRSTGDSFWVSRIDSECLAFGSSE